MTVYKKLQAARHELSKANLKKTGHNSYGGWFYYELGDFIPTVHKLFDAVGLCGVVTFGETATLTIYDAESDGKIEFSTPIVYAEAAKGQPIQLLGSTHTYLRRYLWLMAMEIVESDTVDAEKQEVKQEPVKVVTKPPAKIEGKELPWQLKITAKSDCPPDEWVTIVMKATNLQLSVAQTESDVTNIFKVNRNIFDKLKEIDEDQYKAVLASFKLFKDRLKEKDNGAIPE
jgi:hypothetical protein